MRAASVMVRSYRPPYRIRQRNAAEHFVEPPFLGMDLGHLPALARGEFGHVAREAAVASGFIGIDAGFDLAIALAQDFGAPGARQWDEPFLECGGGHAADSNMHRARRPPAPP